MSLRELVYDRLLLNTDLENLGINSGSLFPNFAPDSPANNMQRWLVIRWGATNTAFAYSPVRSGSITLWAYDRERDFDAIEQVLAAARATLEGLEANGHEGEYFITVTSQGQGEDVYDSVYEAVARTEAYTYSASRAQ